MLWLSISALVLFVCLIFFGKIKLIWASLASLLFTLFFVICVWQIQTNYLFNSFQKGISIAVDILIVIFGAIFFLEILTSTNIIKNLCIFLEAFSKDYRIQVLLIAWFLENFIEGTAGFGAPCTIAAPLLIGIGLSPILAVAVALLGNSASVVFGAAGTPIRVGFAGLNIAGIPLTASLINIVGLIVPIFMLWQITAKKPDSKKQFLEALPFAIISGIAFVIPSVLSVFIGPEFPSILGAVFGTLIILACIKLKLFVPKTIRTLHEENLEKSSLPLYKVLFPYTLLILILLSIKPLNPGYAFILASIPTIFLFGKKHLFEQSIKKSLTKSIEPFLIIAIISIMVQLMLNSGNNHSGFLSMIHIIANSFKTSMLPFFTPLIGAFGSFLTGSATISNIMFGGILQKISLDLGKNVGIILALQLVGGAAGNMISLADVLPAMTVVGIIGQEREVLKRVIVPCLIYLFLVGIIGIIIS